MRRLHHFHGTGDVEVLGTHSPRVLRPEQQRRHVPFHRHYKLLPDGAGACFQRTIPSNHLHVHSRLDQRVRPTIKTDDVDGAVSGDGHPRGCHRSCDWLDGSGQQRAGHRVLVYVEDDPTVPSFLLPEGKPDLVLLPQQHLGHTGQREGRTGPGHELETVTRLKREPLEADPALQRPLHPFREPDLSDGNVRPHNTPILGGWPPILDDRLHAGRTQLQCS